MVLFETLENIYEDSHGLRSRDGCDFASEDLRPAPHGVVGPRDHMSAEDRVRKAPDSGTA